MPPQRRILHLLLTVAVFASFAGPITAQELSIDFGDEGSLTARSLQLIALITVLSLAPGIAIMVTCFPFVVTVLAILRQGIGLQQSPPNMLIVSLALFITYYVMEPVFAEAWQNGLRPLTEGATDYTVAFSNTMAPFQVFMAARVDTDTLFRLAELRGVVPGEDIAATTPLSVLVPSFLLSEIERAFQVGFLIFLPFLVIDLVVASVLMSMGMMMVPPAVVSLPFKLAFFVVADGWTLVSEALVRSYL
ncbi:MAG: flagellar type III secretion system pore protein FliP [Pseudomonadota bacterium]